MLSVFDGPTDGDGLLTITGKVPNGSGGGSGTLSSVEEMKFAANVPTPTWTVAPETKSCPVTERTTLVASARTTAGDTEIAIGAGLLIRNCVAPELPPPGAGVDTTMLRRPAVSMRFPGIVTSRDVAELNTVVRRVAPANATELPAKPEPVSCMSSGVDCFVAAGGTVPVSTGTALVTVNSPPSMVRESGGGFSTPTRKSPERLKASGGIVPGRLVDDTKVVAIGVLAKRIRDAGRKFVPVTVMPIALLPAVAE